MASDSSPVGVELPGFGGGLRASAGASASSSTAAPVTIGHMEKDPEDDGYSGTGLKRGIPPTSLTDYVDWALEQADGAGPFQKFHTILLSFPWVICGMQVLATIFTAQISARTKRARHPSRKGCTVPDYHHDEKLHSIVAMFQLVCEDEMYVPLLNTLFFFGFGIGVASLGVLADTRGRKRAFLWSVALLQTGAFIAMLAPYYSVYALGRIVTGIGTGGLGICCYVLNTELVGRDMRPILLVTSNCAFAGGCLVAAVLSLVVTEWRRFSFVLWLLGLPLICIYAFLIESPKWLASKQQPIELYTLVCDIAQYNGKQVPAVPPSARADYEAPPSVNEAAEDEASSQAKALRQMCCDDRLALRFHSMCLAWFALSLGYYGLSLNAGNLGYEIHLSSAINSLVELPAYFVAYYSVESPYFGRRGSTAGGLVFGGCCCILSAMLADGSGSTGTGLMLLAFIGKSFVSLSFSTVYLYAAELFPTAVRSRSMSLMSLCSRLGGMLAPIVADLGRHSVALPMLIFGAPCVASGLLLLTLAETRGAKMLDTIEDMSTGQDGFCDCFKSYSQLEEKENLAASPT